MLENSRVKLYEILGTRPVISNYNSFNTLVVNFEIFEQG